MYDARNEAHEFTAANREDAIRKARDYFGVEVAELRIGEFPAGEVYGLGGRAVIVASLRDRTRPTPGRSGGRDGGRDGGREEGGRGDRPRRGSGARRGEGRERGEGRDGRDRGRSERGGSSRGDDRGNRGSSSRGDDRGSRGSSSRGEERGASSHDEERLEPAQVLSDEPSVGTAHGDLGVIGQFVLGAIERMKVGPFGISENVENELLAYEVKGAAADVLAGGDGRTVDALQLLANQVAQRHELDVRVVIDVDGNTEGREDFLAQLAGRAASRAGKTGRAVALDPMNGRDRRTIHLALRDEDGVATMSVGEGRYRQVMIVPEGAPEYDQAVRESRSAEPDGNR
jgi:predicted RNA-binding protein Jag